MASKKKFNFYPIFFMLVLSFVLTALLAGLNEFTLPKVEMNRELEIQEKILNVFQIDYEKDNPKSITSSFNDNVETDEFEESPMYIYQDDNGQPIAYAVPFKGPGLWGTIEGFIGITSNMEEITGIEFTDQSETPGLGARIEEDEYKSQYKNLDISSSQADKLIASSPEGQIDQISGATQTSDSVIRMVNKDLFHFIENVGGGN